MKKTAVLFILILFTGFEVFSQSNLLQNLPNRKITSLNGKWRSIVDPYETGYYNYRYEPHDSQPGYEKNPGAIFTDYHPINQTELVEYNFDESPWLLVPRSWNSQDDKLFLYEGTIWYRKLFEFTASDPTNRIFLYFGAVNYQAEVYLNGHKLGIHVGGFTPFNFEITKWLRPGSNSLVVKADNRRKREAIPTVNTDWFNYGGITREVWLVEESQTFIRDYVIQLKKDNPKKVGGFIQLDGSQLNKPVTVEIPELKLKETFQTNSSGWAEVDFSIPDYTPWSTENPKLYTVSLSIPKQKLTDQIGFRTISTQGADLLLNGKSIFLRGISVHEENSLRGDRAWSVEDAQLILGRAKELNCNFVRLAHYPHNENIIREAEKMGILVWSEIPVYWTILWDNQETAQNAENQLTEMITRDRNRANVIIWSVANETPVSEARTKFLHRLVEKARMLDGTRLISAALEKHSTKEDPMTLVIEDPFADFVDVVSVNEYIGWYDGLPEKADRVKWNVNPNKPLIISEFGGDAQFGLHGSKDARWTEEYQEELYIRNLAMLEKIPSLRGMSPWILSDFRSPRRLLPGIQDGWNRKGLFSESGEKKKAFFVLKAYYDKKVNFPR